MKYLIEEWRQRERNIINSIYTLISSFEENNGIKRLSHNSNNFIINKSKGSTITNLSPLFHCLSYQKKRLLEEIGKRELNDIIRLINGIIENGYMKIKELFHPNFIQQLIDLNLPLKIS